MFACGRQGGNAGSSRHHTVFCAHGSARPPMRPLAPRFPACPLSLSPAVLPLCCARREETARSLSRGDYFSVAMDLDQGWWALRTRRTYSEDLRMRNREGYTALPVLPEVRLVRLSI